MSSSSIASPLIIGARSSNLSEQQFKEVKEALLAIYPKIQLQALFLKTKGDKDLSTSLRSLEKTNFFTKELDEYLVSNRIHAAIHSAKDLPSSLPSSLRIAALTPTLDPTDSLVMSNNYTLKTLPKGSCIGCSSQRREEVITQLRDDLQFKDIRGTIEQRLELLEDGKIQGVVIATAALIRLQLTHLNYVILPGKTVPHQGQLAIVVRAVDTNLFELFKVLDEDQQKVFRILYLGLRAPHNTSHLKWTHLPVIRTQCRSAQIPEIQAALRSFRKFTHLIFTSKSSVSYWNKLMLRHSLSNEDLKGKTILSMDTSIPIRET